MKELEKYIIVYAFNTDDLEKKVNIKIEIGYVPLGGVAVLSGHFKDNAGRLYQSMIFNDAPMKATESEEEKVRIKISNEKIYFCPECNTIIEQYKKGIYGCGNEDCGYETDDLENLIIECEKD